jgi:hypothetical protein
VKDGKHYDPLNGARVFVTVTPDLTTATPGTYLSPYHRELAIIEDLLAGRLTADVQSYTLDGTSATKIPIEKLWDRQSWLRSQIAQMSGRSDVIRKIPITYTRTGGH